MGKFPADEQSLKTLARALAPLLVVEIRRLLESEKLDSGGGKIHVGPLTLDTLRHEAFVNGKRLILTPQEFRLLGALAQRPGVVFSRERLLHIAWKIPATMNNPRGVDPHVCRLREKIRRLLGSSGDYVDVVHVPKAGYKLGKSSRSHRNSA